MILFLFFDRKGKGKELKVPHHASAAATRNDHVTTRDIVPTKGKIDKVLRLRKALYRL